MYLFILNKMAGREWALFHLLPVTRSFPSPPTTAPRHALCLPTAGCAPLSSPWSSTSGTRPRLHRRWLLRRRRGLGEGEARTAQVIDLPSSGQGGGGVGRGVCVSGEGRGREACCVDSPCSPKPDILGTRMLVMYMLSKLFWICPVL